MWVSFHLFKCTPSNLGTLVSLSRLNLPNDWECIIRNNIKESVDNNVKFKVFSTVPSKEPSQLLFKCNNWPLPNKLFCFMKSLVRPLEEPFFEKSSQFIAWIQENQQSTERKKNNEKKSQPGISCIFTVTILSKFTGTIRNLLSPWTLTLTEPIPEVFEFPPSDWLEIYLVPGSRSV